MLRYAITDADMPGGEPPGLVARRWATSGVDFVQLRHASLPAGALLTLARQLLNGLHRADTTRAPKLLINSRADVAVAAQAAGVHLKAHAGELSPADVRTLFARAGLPAPIVSISCHTLDELRLAATAGADLMLFAPVFEKRVAGVVVTPGVGLDRLRAAAAIAPGRVLALGGVTHANTASCLAAGAAGVAGIRLFA